jgi:hypothetical protein
MTKWNSFLSLFRSSTGSYDMGRVISFKISSVICTGFLYSVFHNSTPITSWTDVGGGFSALMLGIGGLIAVKEFGVAKANAMNGATANAAE